eukprot:927656-Prorocentrum_minimum.AAC.1
MVPTVFGEHDDDVDDDVDDDDDDDDEYDGGDDDDDDDDMWGNISLAQGFGVEEAEPQWVNLCMLPHAEYAGMLAANQSSADFGTAHCTRKYRPPKIR